MSLAALWSHIPSTIQLGCEMLVLVWLAFLIYMILSSYSVKSQLNRFTRLFASTDIPTQSIARSGLDLESLDKLRTLGDNGRDLIGVWWQRLDSHIEMYVGPDENERYFVTEPIRDIMPYEEIVGGKYYGSFFSLVPGILTGAGLSTPQI